MEPSHRQEPTTRPPLRVIISGSSGLIGGALSNHLTRQGHQVDRLVRHPAREGSGEIQWQPGEGRIDGAALEEAEVIIHLAGANIARGRWTPTRKAAIMESRRDGTLLLSRSLAKMKAPPKVLISASAVGYYGDRGTEEVDENTPPGKGFLSEVCRAWEEATAPAEQAGIRVINLRIGLVLTPTGGALAKMLAPFRLGLGGVIGNGKQIISWIELEDLLGVFDFALYNHDLKGPLNAVTPFPVSNREFTRKLGRILNRPTFLPLPAPAVRLIFGEMGKELLLQGAKVNPAKLVAAGYQFLYPTLEAALEASLNKSPND